MTEPTMTLEQVRDEVFNRMTEAFSVGDTKTFDVLEKWFESLDAELKARGEAVAWKHETPYGTGYSFASDAIMRDMADWLAPPAPKVDGYAVLLSDKASATHGYWFAGIYHDKESAELLAKKNGKCEVRPMTFAAEGSG